eukprot:5229448-Pyramimonas_sp.AAC.1
MKDAGLATGGATCLAKQSVSGPSLCGKAPPLVFCSSGTDRRPRVSTVTLVLRKLLDSQLGLSAKPTTLSTGEGLDPAGGD